MNTPILLASAACVFGAALMSFGQADPPKVEKPTTITKSCITADCHPKIGKNKFQHGPIAQNGCLPCHKVLDAKTHKFGYVDDGKPSMCLQCHEIQAPKQGGGAPGRPGKAAPAKPGAGKAPAAAPTGSVHKPYTESCLACHRPHGAETKGLLKAKTLEQSCDECHPDTLKGMKHLHGPAGAKACTACHSPHFSSHKMLLIKSEKDLCFSCHELKEEQLRKATTVHKAVKDGCINCHDSHGSNHKMLLLDEPMKACRKCHTQIMERTATAKNPHKAVLEDGQCLNCHDIHYSAHKHLLKRNSKELCLNCHDRRISLKPEEGKRPRSKKALADIASQIKKHKFLHGPITEDNCIDCHNAHGSDHNMILRDTFPGNFYARGRKEAYQACFKCHDPRLLETERTTTATNFRNGDKNLHHLHTFREKGRSCRACHHEHGADQPHLIRSTTPFGSWKMKNRFTKTKTGGGCLTGCHKLLKYDREKPVPIEAEGESKPK